VHEPAAAGLPHHACTVAHGGVAAATPGSALCSVGAQWRDATSCSDKNSFRLLLFDCDFLQVFKLKYTKW
jgi:hypothetical protein